MTEHADPYLWLEPIDGAKAVDWVEAQNAQTRSVLDADPRFEPLAEEILQSLRDTRQIPYFNQHGDWLYNFHQSAEHPRGVYRRATLAAYRAGASDWQVVLDIDRLAESEGQDWYLEGVSHYTLAPSRCLLTLCQGGSDAAVTREYDLEAADFVEGGFSLPFGKNHVAWRDPDSLFVCPAWDEAQCTRAGYPREVWILSRGADWSQARRLFAASQDAMMVTAWRFLACDGGYLDMIESSDSFYRKTYHVVDADLTTRALPLPAEAEVLAWLHGDLVVKLAQDWQRDEQLLPAGALVTYTLASDRVAVLVAPGERASVDSVECSRGFILVNLLENVRSRLLAFGREEGGWREWPLQAQADGVIEFVDQPWESDSLYYSYSDFLTPTGLYRLELPHGEPECLRSQPAAFDADRFVAEQWAACAPDGTAIPYFIVRPRDLPFDGRAPTLLYGYGGFEVAMLPYYMDNFGPHWLEKGGVFVVANIRGGGEFGPAWHQAAQGVRRAVSFEDFIAVAEDLIARGVTDSRHLAIEGGSNGGLLVGAAMVRRPELFQAVVCEVPLLDMLRYTRLLAGASWIDEYGDPDDADQRPHLQAYSPYHQLRPGVTYPQALFTTSRRDDRVHPAHARKMVARLNELGQPPLFYETDSGGHSGNAGQVQTATDLARVLVYLYQRLFD
ncbi:prolyl oligopeptidase family serine peptidase [Paludibacterium purpuratum]|uniref:Prolyl oligopeptidase n=1 Tax=Paludibacterium purpuratum TaxID=1144873 RepID=A0A4R7B6U2_9NEIS|nr:prolyl oligopeptidase family serine peptidase [Paludibacterium purpuratum]TDR80401.1 prolyl oligopeptidase [Paludibacterium purpuratum]